MKIKKSTMWKGVSAVLAVLLIISIYTGGFKSTGKDSDIEEEDSSVELSGDFSAVLLNDERCAECDSTGLITQLKTTFPNLEIVELDYSDKEGKAFYEDNELTLLPAVLFTESVKEQEGYEQVQSYLEEKGDYLSLKIGASFDPNSEICDNEEDDNGDGKVDCEDDSCKNQWKCMEKKDKPVVEAFVMSHCPYGTQIEKGLLPVAELLGDKIDFEIKFCDYAMHGEKELDEQTRQYCIQTEQNDKYLDYLKCFLEDDDYERCLVETEIDEDKLDPCVEATDEEFKITENFADKSTWKGNYPTFNVYKEEVDKYSVGGSPTLVINGVTASAGRDSASLLSAICTGFKDKPSECDEELDSASPSPGFGFEASGDATAATCG